MVDGQHYQIPSTKTTSVERDWDRTFNSLQIITEDSQKSARCRSRTFEVVNLMILEEQTETTWRECWWMESTTNRPGGSFKQLIC